MDAQRTNSLDINRHGLIKMEKLLNIFDSYVGVLKTKRAGPWSTEVVWKVVSHSKEFVFFQEWHSATLEVFLSELSPNVCHLTLLGVRQHLVAGFLRCKL